MSNPLFPDAFVRLRTDAAGLLGRAAAHQHQLEALVLTAESEVLWAKSTLSGAIAGTEGALQVSNLLRWQVQRSVEAAASAKRLCVAAREQRHAAALLLAQFDGDESGGQQWRSRRAEAVLVVDDNDDVRELVSVVLQNAGFVVRTAANGLEALFAAYEMQPAVIVMDLAMPVLDGMEATRLIKASRATRDTRIIAYTGNTDLPDDQDHKLFVAVLRKPAEPDVVLSAVHQAVSV